MHHMQVKHIGTYSFRDIMANGFHLEPLKMKNMNLYTSFPVMEMKIPYLKILQLSQMAYTSHIRGSSI